MNDLFNKSHAEIFEIEKITSCFVDCQVQFTYYPNNNSGYSEYYYHEAVSKLYSAITDKSFYSKIKFNYISKNSYYELRNDNELPENDLFLVEVFLPEINK